MIRVHGIRPIYWGVEDTTEVGVFQRDRRRLTRAWMVEDRPPWRKSIAAFRIRIGRYGLHLGLCRKQREGERPWQGRYASVQQISTWRSLGGEPEVGMEESEDGEALPGPDEVRQTE